MTIKELLEHQQQSGNICLIRQGLFFRAYNQGAALLNSLCGYQIRCKQSKSCGAVLYYVGFPASVVDKVTAKIVEQGGIVVKHEDNYIECSNMETVYDEERLKTTAVLSTARVKQGNTHTVIDSTIEAIKHFDTLNATALGALQFIDQLQKQLNEKKVSNNE